MSLGKRCRSAERLSSPNMARPMPEYDQLLKKDKGRNGPPALENILGAIRNNANQLPELKDRLVELIKGPEVKVTPKEHVRDLLARSSKESVYDVILRSPGAPSLTGVPTKPFCMPVCPTSAWLRRRRISLIPHVAWKAAAVPGRLSVTGDLCVPSQRDKLLEPQKK